MYFDLKVLEGHYVGFFIGLGEHLETHNLNHVTESLYANIIMYENE